MRRRQGFTLVELIVAMALIVMMMTILSWAFANALDTFQQMKAIGDLEERLRSATVVLRRDIAADHLEGKRRIGDSQYWPANSGAHPRPIDRLGLSQGVAREGFIRLINGGLTNEGSDGDGIASVRVTGDVLHFSVKLRGNNRHDFFSAQAPGLMGRRTTYFNQPFDTFYVEGDGTLRSQWGEIAYFLHPNGQSTIRGNTPLYGLWRCQYLVIPDTTTLTGISGGWQNYCHISCQGGGTVTFNNPTDMATNVNRRAFDARNVRGTFNPNNPEAHSATLVMPDVISFDVKATTDGINFGDINYDSRTNTNRIRGLRVSLRVWDVRSETTRQITIYEDF